MRRFTLAMFVLTPLIALGQGTALGQGVSALPEVAELPNPFIFLDGSAVKSPADWERRRGELKMLFEHNMYGHLPLAPDEISVEWDDATEDAERGVSVQGFTMRIDIPVVGSQPIDLHGRLTLPLGAEGRLPVVIQGGRLGPPRRPRGEGAQRGPQRSLYADRGYAEAVVDFQEAGRDSKEAPRDSGVYKVYGSNIDTGVLMAWAWAMHRVIDALEQHEKIDTEKVVVTGHSRNGKAALLAGAFDERIAITVPQHSGCGGAAPYRFIYGESEQLHNAWGYAPQWFSPVFGKYVGEVNRLPVDQHLLRALVAPRAQMSTEGTNDSWVNPEGSQLTYLAAKEVYKFLGAEDQISIRYRPVGHVPSTEDLLDFADHVFFNKPLPEPFGELPYPVETEAYSWSAPQ